MQAGKWTRISLNKTPNGNDEVVSKSPTPQGFEPFEVQGFVNTGKSGDMSCDSLRHAGELYAEMHHDVGDDIHAIAESLKDHPMVDYSTQDKELTHEEVVEKTWLRMAQSSVWLQHYGVFLTVTRVAFYTKGVRQWPIISFLRAQIHDRDWKELRDHDIHWQGETIRFPRILDIPVPYVIEGAFYGPEDPRIIVEGHPEAEPVIVFSMLYDVQNLRRAMYITRPFSNETTMLHTPNGHLVQTEKNWVPFVYKEPSTGNAPTGLDASHNDEWPMNYLHFIYDLKPLRVLKCCLLDGWCDWVYEQKVPDSHSEHHKDRGGILRGGTNLVALSVQDGVQTFIGFPKSNVHLGCKEAFYRPSIFVITAASPNQFHIDYMSDSIEYGDQALIPTAKSDPCGEGRIMMANSIAKWDRSAGKDLMTITYTVDDVTTQTLRIYGIEAFVNSMLNRSRFDPSTSESRAYVDPDLLNQQRSDAGYNVLACSVEAAEDYALLLSATVNGTDLRTLRLEEKKILQEEE